MDVKKLDQNEDLKNDGVWMRWDSEGGMVKIRHTYSKKYTQARQEAERKLRRQKMYRPDKSLSTEEELEITKVAVAHGMIVDWKGFRDGDAEFPYSEANALDLCQRVSFCLKAVNMGADDANYELENLEILGGN